MVPAAVLGQPVHVLQGITSDAEAALRLIGIETVLDLAASALFGLARRVAEAAGGEGPLGPAGPLPADMIDDTVRGLSAAEVARRPIEILRMLSPAEAGHLAAALPAATVRDLGLWPPALAAQRLLNIAYGGEDPDVDPETPAELQPRMGRLPVDRVQYDVLLYESDLAEFAAAMAGPDEDMGGDPKRPGIRGPLPGSGLGAGGNLLEGQEFPLDLTDRLMGAGFAAPGIGFVLTIAQSWYSVGLSLGQLLHSLALAPGEATRVAVIDWSRRVAGSTTDDIRESEQLTSEIERNRTINEIVDAVNKEAQSGFSGIDMKSSSGGFSLAGMGRGDDYAFGGGMGYAGTSASGTAASSSQGERTVGGKMAQTAHDRTEQAASLTRGRKASIVSEVSTTEAERLTTRIVANYNHMHALSVLYFEVVQLYRVVTETVGAEPVLYLPVRPLDFGRTNVFGRNSLVERFRAVLARAALSPQARDALLGVVPPPAPAPKAEGSLFEMSFGKPSDTPLLVDERGARIDWRALEAAFGSGADLGPNRVRFDSRHARLAEVQLGTFDRTQRPVATQILLTVSAATTRIDVEQWARPPKDPARYAPDPGDSRTAFRALVPKGWPLDQGEAQIMAQGGGKWHEEVASARDLAVWPDMRLVFALLDPATGQETGKTASFAYTALSPEPSGDFRVVRLVRQASTATPPATPVVPPFDLAAHLRANALHYTMALLRLGDPALLGAVLSGLKLGGKQLMGQVNPRPIASVGNMLVFRWPALKQDPAWKRLLEERGLLGGNGLRRLGDARESLVPVASGGVFAEAVLGRFNSAEKLDLTRFWNWQDSPMPLVPPDIAPIQAGGREGADPLKTGALGEANLKVSVAPQLPDPTGALVKAIETAANGDSFRDMSGLAGLTGAAGTAMTLTARNAQKFMETAMQTVSSYGARINHGKKMDEEAAAAEEATDKKGSPASGGSGSGGTGSGGTGSGGTGTGSGGTGSGTGGKSQGGPVAPGPSGTQRNEGEAFRGPQPDPPVAPPSAPAQRTFDVLVRLFRAKTASGQGQAVLGMHGEFELPPLVFPNVPGQDLIVGLQGGVGSGKALWKGPASRAALSGKLMVSRWDVIGPGTYKGLTDVFGVPGDTVPFAIIDTLRELNEVPLIGEIVSLPDDGGTLQLDLEVATYPASELARDLAGDAEFNATLAPMELEIRPLLAGNVATPAEVGMVRGKAISYAMERFEEIERLFNSRGKPWNPLLRIDVSMNPLTGVCTLTPYWCALSSSRLVAARV